MKSIMVIIDEILFARSYILFKEKFLLKF
jgi:hypothetical protein